MVAPDVEKLRRLRECAEAFEPASRHGLGAVKECLLAARCFIDGWITLIDRATAAASQAGAQHGEAHNVDIQ